jgi:predicted nucleic acid-binding protein
MIAADTSSMVAYFLGGDGKDVEQVDAALATGDLVLPPAVLTELLSDPALEPAVDNQIRRVATLDILEGYWLRAGEARRTLIRYGLKAKVGDALIAQSCIDHRVKLIARDTDFRHFARHCGLLLA